MSKPKPRILMISIHGYVSAEPELGKPDTGGQVLYVLELSRSLAQLGYHVDILTRQFEGQPKHEDVGPGVDLWRVPCGGKEFIPKETMHEHLKEWVLNAKTWAAGKRREYQFINSHYWDAGLAGQTLANAWGIPHVHTPHSIGSWKRDNMPGDPAELDRIYNFSTRIREEKIMYDECDLLVATTPQQRDILMAAEYDVPSEKICVVPAGYDDTRFFPVSLATRGALKREHDLEGPVVLALGRIAKNKGYDLLVRAMKPVVARIEDARLLLAVGSTEPNEDETRQINELKDLARKEGIAEHVVFHDYIDDEELADHYRLADVFALSSRYEPFGMTAIEAMACGTPTVVTTEGGLWEQVVWGVEAIYANPFDPEAFGHAIYSALKYDRVRDTLAKYGSQVVRAKFTWTGIAQQILRQTEDLPRKPLSEEMPTRGKAVEPDAAPAVASAPQDVVEAAEEALV